MTEPGDELERSRREFEAKVRATPAPRPPAPGGKGSPGALVVTGLIGTALLAARRLANLQSNRAPGGAD